MRGNYKKIVPIIFSQTKKARKKIDDSYGIIMFLSRCRINAYDKKKESKIVSYRERCVTAVRLDRS